MKFVVEGSIVVGNVVLSVNFKGTDVNVVLEERCFACLVKSVGVCGDSRPNEDMSAFWWYFVVSFEFPDVDFGGMSVWKSCGWGDDFDEPYTLICCMGFHDCFEWCVPQCCFCVGTK